MTKPDEIEAAERRGFVRALERAAQAVDLCCNRCGERIRAMIPPAAAPAAETGKAQGAEARCPFDEQDCLDARQRIAELEKALRGARAIIDRDRTGLAAGLNAAVNATRSYWWIANGEWSGHHYTEQNEKTLRAEVKNAFEEIAATAARALSESGRLASESCREIDAKLAARAAPPEGEGK